MFLIEAVFMLICCCALLKFISNMILPENEFSHLKGVNNRPYLDIRTSASHLTKRFLFSCISLFNFLLSYVFFIHPIGHFQVAFWIHSSMSCSQEPLIIFSIGRACSTISSRFAKISSSVGPKKWHYN